MDDSSLFVILKSIHMVAVTTTLAGLLVRGWWMLSDSKLLSAKPVKIFPHANDTVLISSALAAGYVSGQLPFVDPWLTAKLFGVIAYVVFSAGAFTFGKTKQQRIIFLILAAATFAYIILVAACRSPVACIS
jgi:uncharacterized membrane protein SirB2